MMLWNLFQYIFSGSDWIGKVDGKVTSVIIVNPNILERLMPDKDGVFGNPNFWTFLSGILGALIGASTTFLFQRSIELKKRNTDVIEEYLRASWAIVRAVGVSRSFFKGSFGELKVDPIRHLQIRNSIVVQHNVPTIDISKLIGRSVPAHSDLFNGIENTLANLLLLYKQIEERNDIYLNKFLPQLDEAKRMLGKPMGFDSNEIIQVIPRETQMELKGVTDAIYHTLELIETLGSSVIDKIAVEIIRIDRRQMLIGLEPIV